MFITHCYHRNKFQENFVRNIPSHREKEISMVFDKIINQTRLVAG